MLPQPYRASTGTQKGQLVLIKASTRLLPRTSINKTKVAAMGLCASSPAEDGVLTKKQANWAYKVAQSCIGLWDPQNKCSIGTALLVDKTSGIYCASRNNIVDLAKVGPIWGVEPNSSVLKKLRKKNVLPNRRALEFQIPLIDRQFELSLIYSDPILDISFLRRVNPIPLSQVPQDIRFLETEEVLDHELKDSYFVLGMNALGPVPKLVKFDKVQVLSDNQLEVSVSVQLPEDLAEVTWSGVPLIKCRDKEFSCIGTFKAISSSREATSMLFTYGPHISYLLEEFKFMETNFGQVAQRELHACRGSIPFSLNLDNSLAQDYKHLKAGSKLVEISLNNRTGTVEWESVCDNVASIMEVVDKNVGKKLKFRFEGEKPVKIKVRKAPLS